MPSDKKCEIKVRSKSGTAVSQSKYGTADGESSFRLKELERASDKVKDEPNTHKVENIHVKYYSFLWWEQGYANFRLPQHFYNVCVLRFAFENWFMDRTIWNRLCGGQNCTENVRAQHDHGFVIDNCNIEDVVGLWPLILWKWHSDGRTLLLKLGRPCSILAKSILRDVLT